LTRIVYLAFAPEALSGGNKMAFRHVEALTALGFDAVVRLAGRADGRRPVAPTWFEHTARLEDATAPLGDSDILVLPEDDVAGLRAYAAHPNPKIVFCQNIYFAASEGLGRLTPQEAGAYREFLVCSPGVAATVARFFDYERISVAPGFADERIFAPGPKERIIACIPRKRRMEYEVIRHMFARLRPAGPVWEWQVLDGVSEREVAQAMSRAAVFLSLNRFEGMSLTAVEAMASGCIVAGFTGIGPREYMNSVNGFWAGEDDCEACAEALVRAVALAEEGAGGAALMRHAGQATAHQWSYANFLSALEAFWRGRLA
jgi:glycosyltransferase involved in cell wall biosynthesis